ncbi:hypothetical protein O3M35_007588 [Rhynocoris fuscipes]|uniref:Uncharacterized protein n=1 Tax=Rhynocoris fuscipes TaxID=488301 RepID=A0AAW1D9X8_9HEMI
MGDKSSGEGAPPPPSPLTGAYLLIVLPQTHLPQHKDNVLHNLTKGNKILYYIILINII